MGGVTRGKTLLKALEEAETLLRHEGFDGESDAIGEALSLLKIVDIDELIATKLISEVTRLHAELAARTAERDALKDEVEAINGY